MPMENCEEFAYEVIVELEPDTGGAGRKYGYSILSEDFRLAVSDIMGNECLKRFSEHLFWRSNVYISLFRGYYTQEDFVRHIPSPPRHWKIVEATECLGAERAGEPMARHIRFAFEHIVDLIRFRATTQ